MDRRTDVGSVFHLHCAYAFGPILVTRVGIVYFPLVCVAPIAVLWTRHMDRGVQAAITVSLVIFTSVLVCPSLEIYKS